MNFERAPYLTPAVRGPLAVASGVALLTRQCANAFVIITALILTLLPRIFSNRFHIQLPLSFLAAIFLFLFGAQFLGELSYFYNNFFGGMSFCAAVPAWVSASSASYSSAISSRAIATTRLPRPLGSLPFPSRFPSVRFGKYSNSLWIKYLG